MTVGKDGETLRDLATNPVKQHAAGHVRRVLREGLRKLAERQYLARLQRMGVVENGDQK
jgi:hypothetical protein